MGDSSNKGLRELAHAYYKGELSYESYRSERTQLLDRVTGVTGDGGCTRSATGQANKPGVADQLLDHKSERSRCIRRTVKVLIVVLIAIFLLVWAMRSGWLALPVGQLDSADTAVYYADTENAGANSGENYRQLNG